MLNLPMSREEFIKHIRDAYNRMYDSPYLRTHPLGDILLSPEARQASHRSQNLRRVLLDAIETLKPQSGMPVQAPDWRIYRTFELRYIEGLSANEAMEQLAVSKSQFFRDHAEGLEHILEILWAKRIEMPVSDSPQAETTVASETARLFANATWETIDVSQVLADMQTVIQALSRIHHVQVECIVPNSLIVRADRVILRQAVLNLITFAVTHTLDQRVEMGCYTDERETGLTISFPVQSETSPSAVPSEFQVAVELMRVVGGQFRMRDENAVRTITMVWSDQSTRVLLIVDDNEGLHDLYRRYLAGQSWQVIGARNGTEARQLILEKRPTVILLDVMMPEEDGWELLVAFRGTPELADIPVIICSVVNEPQLAANLGATSYLTKPVTLQSLVNALAPWS
jgi:CheY-like chemotaxis protein